MLSMSYQRGSSCVVYVELQPDASCITVIPPSSNSAEHTPITSAEYVDIILAVCFILFLRAFAALSFVYLTQISQPWPFTCTSSRISFVFR